MSQVRTEFGFERTACACSECAINCRFIPGYLIPADLDRIAGHLGSENLIEFALDVISRRRYDYSGGFTPFFTEVNATLHRSGRDWIAFIQ